MWQACAEVRKDRLYRLQGEGTAFCNITVGIWLSHMHAQRVPRLVSHIFLFIYPLYTIQTLSVGILS